jgi:hypothetical protein
LTQNKNELKDNQKKKKKKKKFLNK